MINQSFLPYASLVVQNPSAMVKNPSAMQETWVLSLGWEDPLEKGTATHSSILACIVHGVTKSWTQLSGFHFTLPFENLTQFILANQLNNEKMFKPSIFFLIFTLYDKNYQFRTFFFSTKPTEFYHQAIHPGLQSEQKSGLFLCIITGHETALGTIMLSKALVQFRHGGAEGKAVTLT